jgi:glycosyltransferase involved in cell wall biosynthesis
MSVLVSVVIPAYNAARWIGEALASVVDQAVSELEVIVIDDGSDDGTAAMVQHQFPLVHLERTPRRGPSAARELGTRLASGAFIQYLDADDVLAPGKLRTQLAALERSGGDVAYGDWRTLVETAGGRCTPGRLVARQLHEPETELLTTFWCPPAVYLFGREIVERVGGWHAGLEVIQDARFALDCALRGGAFVYCPGVMAAYRVHSGESVSRRRPERLRQECFLNASEVEAWWRGHGGLTPARHRALLQAYYHVARASFVAEPPLFARALSALNRIEPGFVPSEPWHLALVARVAGYERAERLAAHFRAARHAARGRIGAAR